MRCGGGGRGWGRGVSRAGTFKKVRVRSAYHRGSFLDAL